MKVDGGIKVSKKLNVGGDADLGAKLIVKTNPDTSEKNVKVNGSLEVTGDIKASGNIVLTDATTLTLGTKAESNTNSAGLLTVYTTAGNDGFKVDNTGDVTVGDDLIILGAADVSKSGASYSAALKVSGGVRVDKKLNVGGELTTNSTTNLGGKLTITSGGADITGNTTISGTLNTTNNVTIGTETTNANLTINGDVTTTGTFEATDKTKTHTIGAVKINDSTVTGLTTLTATGTINAQVFNSTSDIRKKTNIEDYRSEKSILDLPIKSFEYKDDINHNRYIGCIAQDLQQICPELVSSDDSGFLHIQESKLIYLLLQEVKELKEKVEKLERR